MSGLTHEEWRRDNGLELAPRRSRYLELKERIADAERMAERADDVATRAPDAAIRRRHTETADRYRRQIARLLEELDLYPAEPVEAGLCPCCGAVMTNAQVYATRACAKCADPYLSLISERSTT